MYPLGTANRTLRVAIIGSGPTGFYTADHLFKSNLSVEVCIFEQWPVPFGLIRFGVAPDKQNTKQVTRLFERIARDQRFRFYGNVHIGRDLTVQELGQYFDALVFTHGAESHRRLNVPGEDLPGSYSANEFVGWYNGHPEYRDLNPDLSREAAVVVGNGNVAMDVARMLVRHPDDLAKTDISPYALETLQRNTIRTVYVVGRRGPAQAAFTHPELLELDAGSECQAVVEAAELELNRISENELTTPGAGKRQHVMQVLQDFASASAARKARRRVSFKFQRSPVAIEGDERVEGVRFEHNALTGDAGAQRAEGTGILERIDCGLVVRCIGYRGTAIDGLPFDEGRGVVPNAAGRIVDGPRVLPGLYAAGWIKHGPVGLIATGKKDVASVVAEIHHDVLSLQPCPTPDTAAMEELLAERAIPVVNFDGWKRIDDAEIARGKSAGKPREKFTTVDDMLAAAGL